jgi:hypothetical protein
MKTVRNTPLQCFIRFLPGFNCHVSLLVHAVCTRKKNSLRVPWEKQTREKPNQRRRPGCAVGPFTLLRKPATRCPCSPAQDVRPQPLLRSPSAGRRPPPSVSPSAGRRPPPSAPAQAAGLATFADRREQFVTFGCKLVSASDQQMHIFGCSQST